MKIALCYESVLPSRGGCATYIADLARRLVTDNHEVHLYACRWDDAALPADLVYHRLPPPTGPRFLKPWRFAGACLTALEENDHHVSVGFDKTWGQDVLYPQGGLHVASAEHNLQKYRSPFWRAVARGIKWVDPAHRSYCRLEQRQYLGDRPPLVVVNSTMVREHFEKYYGGSDAEVRVIRSAIDPSRFAEHDRPRRRMEYRQKCGIGPQETVAVFLAMNYRLKGLEPLLHAVRVVPRERPFRLLVAGNPAVGSWQRLARRIGVADRVCFAGYCADARNCYFASDFLVHPTFYDPCSLVVLEALACGLPVITSKLNGASELLTPPKEGYVVADPHQHAHLGWCMTQLLDPARRLACAQAARQTAMQWTFEQHYRQLLHVFAEAAARRWAA